MKFLLVVTIAAVVALSSSEAASANETCPEFCTLDYRPVCGTVGGKRESFPNRCSFDLTECNNRVQNKPKVEFIRNGPC